MKRTLKNWIITAESVKKGREGLIAYHSYLQSQTEHKGQTIVPLTSKQNLFNMVRAADGFNLDRQLRKGGRPSNFGWSATLSYPFHISDENLVRIYQANMTKLLSYVNEYNELNMSDEDIALIIKNRTLAVIHRGEDINNHLHLVIPKHFKRTTLPDKRTSIVSIDLTQKKYLHRLKVINNESVNEIVGADVLDYEVKSHEKHKKRVSKGKYKAKQDYASKTAKNASKANELYLQLEEQYKRYSEWAKENKTHDDKEIKRLERAKKQLENGNTDRAEATLKKSSTPPTP